MKTLNLPLQNYVEKYIECFRTTIGEIEFTELIKKQDIIIT
jgi:hypothetical protein